MPTSICSVPQSSRFCYWTGGLAGAFLWGTGRSLVISDRSHDDGVDRGGIGGFVLAELPQSTCDTC